VSALRFSRQFNKRKVLKKVKVIRLLQITKAITTRTTATATVSKQLRLPYPKRKYLIKTLESMVPPGKKITLAAMVRSVHLTQIFSRNRISWRERQSPV
jgi:hypothetical protein